jgi:hypothetical protein
MLIHSHPLCVVKVRKKKKNKIKKIMKKINNKIPKVNLILSHANHTFRILDPQIGLPLDTLIAP